MANAYTGDVDAAECWRAITEDGGAFLIDVRTKAEWTYVGVPVVTGGARPPIFAEWQVFPSMAVDPAFADAVADHILKEGGHLQSPLYFLCRSGVRSQGSAAALTDRGFSRCFNVLDGFEGPVDAEGHRGRTAGWKAAGLPWMQR